MIYTYSPNWYKPQCLHFANDFMYYCSNYLLYEYDLNCKTVTREICFRQIAIQYHLNHKDIKISAIQSSESMLIIGLNQPYIVTLDKKSLETIKVVEIEGFETVQYIHIYKQDLLQFAILCNKDGNLMKYSLDQQKYALKKVEIKHKLNAIKAIYSINQHHCAIFTRGTILVYNSDFSKLEKVIEVSFSDTIYSVDCYREQQKVYFAFLTKNKQSHSLTIFQFKYQEQFPLQLKKKVQEIGIDIKKFDVNIYYPKKFTEKLKLNQKASLTIKLLSSTKVIITGKLGDIATLDVQSIKNGQNLIIKPYSMQQEEAKQYQIWTDSRHYKEIYYIYQYRNRLYIISTDHNLTIWEYNKTKQLKYIYTVKFLTSSVQSFFYSQGDPRNIFALLKDSVVRSFSPLDEGSHQMSEYWKFTKKYKIKKAIVHPTEQGIISLVTQCNRIQIYDAFEDRLMKIIEIGEEILNISYQYPQVAKQIEGMLKYEFKQVKYPFLSHFIKEIEDPSILLIQTKNNLIIAKDTNQKEVLFAKGPRERRLERIHENRYWDRQLLLATHSKNNVLELLICYMQKIIVTQVNLKYQQGRVLFKSPKNTKEIYVINFKGPKFNIFKLAIDSEVGSCSLILSTEVLLQHPIDYLHLNYSDWRIAVYNQREDAITVIHLNLLTQQKYQVNKKTQFCEIYNISSKLDSLMFYLDKYLIVATKDQTIKVIEYLQLPEYRKQNAIKKRHGEVTKIICVGNEKLGNL